MLPRLEGAVALQLRMVIRLLVISERELRLAQPHAAAEATRLGALLGRQADLGEARRYLAQHIRARDHGLDPQALAAHLSQTTRDMLVINNPAWLSD